MSINKNGRLTVCALLGVASLAGCDGDADSPLAPEPIAEETALDAAVRVPVVWFATGVPTDGTSKVVRTPNGISYQLQAVGLEPGHAYTLWIVIFNDTAECLAPIPGVTSCGADDIVNAAARPDMMYAGGNIAGGSGRATFAGRRPVGTLAGSINAPVGLPAFGLEDPANAEIFLAVHDHGPKNSAYLPDMTKSIDGGCTDAGVPAAGVPSPWNDYAGDPLGAYGRRGSNTCATVQIAFHTP